MDYWKDQWIKRYKNRKMEEQKKKMEKTFI